MGEPILVLTSLLMFSLLPLFDWTSGAPSREGFRRCFIEKLYSHSAVDKANDAQRHAVICLLQFGGGRLANFFNPLSKSASTLLYLVALGRDEQASSIAFFIKTYNLGLYHFTFLHSQDIGNYRQTGLRQGFSPIRQMAINSVWLPRLL